MDILIVEATGLTDDYLNVYAGRIMAVEQLGNTQTDRRDEQIIPLLLEPIPTYQQRYSSRLSEHDLRELLQQANPSSLEQVNQLAYEFNALPAGQRLDSDILNRFGKRCEQLLRGK